MSVAIVQLRIYQFGLELGRMMRRRIDFTPFGHLYYWFNIDWSSARPGVACVQAVS